MKQLYKRVCPSVGWSVGPSVGPSVRNQLFFRLTRSDLCRVYGPFLEEVVWYFNICLDRPRNNKFLILQITWWNMAKSKTTLARFRGKVYFFGDFKWMSLLETKSTFLQKREGRN